MSILGNWRNEVRFQSLRPHLDQTVDYSDELTIRKDLDCRLESESVKNS